MSGIIAAVGALLFIIGGTIFGAGAGWIAAALRSIKGGAAVGLILGAMFVGFVVGGFGGALSYTSIKARERIAREGWNLKPVVVAAVDIPAGTVVTFDEISQRSLPEQFVSAAMIGPSDVMPFMNKKTRYALQAGDPLLKSITCP